MHATNCNGWVVYQGERVRGMTVRKSGQTEYTFIPRGDADNWGKIPTTGGWRRAANCCATSYCDVTRRCVGGCRK